MVMITIDIKIWSMKRLKLVILALLCLLSIGCSRVGSVLKRDIKTVREAFGWKAEDYFEDPQAIELCHAIEAKDFKRIDVLLDGGVDVNLWGKDAMTFLLWSFPVPIGTDIECTAHLLKRGADPNVKIESDFGSEWRLPIGDSVTSMAATHDIETLRLVLEHGGDPNIKNSSGDTPLHMVVKKSRGDARERIELLLEHGADINGLSRSTGETPVMLATGWGGQYDLALFLLEKGASHDVYKNRTNQRLMHYVVMAGNRPGLDKVAYDRLLKYLVDKGESVAEVQADHDRWREWSKVPRLTVHEFENERALRQLGEAKEAGKKFIPEKESIENTFVVGGGESVCEVALIVYKEGAEYWNYSTRNGCYFRVIHYLAMAEPQVNEKPIGLQANYRALVAWLEERGESLAEAKADIVRWEQWRKEKRMDLVEAEHQQRLIVDAQQAAQRQQADEAKEANARAALSAKLAERRRKEESAAAERRAKKPKPPK